MSDVNAELKSQIISNRYFNPLRLSTKSDPLWPPSDVICTQGELFLTLLRGDDWTGYVLLASAAISHACSADLYTVASCLSAVAATLIV